MPALCHLILLARCLSQCAWHVAWPTVCVLTLMCLYLYPPPPQPISPTLSPWSSAGVLASIHQPLLHHAWPITPSPNLAPSAHGHPSTIVENHALPHKAAAQEPVPNPAAHDDLPMYNTPHASIASLPHACAACFGHVEFQHDPNNSRHIVV